MDYVLKHYGIKGQKWGNRRFQNEDGSYTPAGRERYLKYVEESGRVHAPESEGGGGGGEPEEELEEVTDSGNEKKKKKKKKKGHKTGGHNLPVKNKSMKELASEEGQRKLEKAAKRKAEEAVKAIDELNKEIARGERLKRERLGNARRFGTNGKVNEQTYSLTEYSKLVDSGREYFQKLKR